MWLYNIFMNIIFVNEQKEIDYILIFSLEITSLPQFKWNFFYIYKNKKKKWRTGLIKIIASFSRFWKNEKFNDFYSNCFQQYCKYKFNYILSGNISC